MKLRYLFDKSTYPQGSKITIPFGIKKMKIKSDRDSVTISEIISDEPTEQEEKKDAI